MNKKQYESEEEFERRRAYEAHKCNGCVWGTWLNKNTVVSCLRPLSCVREDK